MESSSALSDYHESALATVRDLSKKWGALYELAAERAWKAEKMVEELRDRNKELEERVQFWKTEARSNRVRSRSPHR